MLPGKSYSLPDVLAMVRRRLPLLVIPPFVGLFAALLYAATLSNVYRSDVLIGIIPQRVPSNFVQTTVTMRTEDGIDTITTQIKSRTVLEQLILEFNLYPAERRRVPMEDVIDVMRSAIEVELEALRKGPQGLLPPHAFHVRFSYADPIIATRVAERLSSLYVDQNARDRGASANATNQFLEQQLAEARARLVETEGKLERFREQHGNELPTQAQSNMQAMQGMQLQIQAIVEGIARDRDRKLMLERLYGEAEKEPVVAAVAPAGQAGEGGAAQTGSYRQRLTAARENLARLELRLTPLHPDIVSAKRQIADLEPKAAEEAVKIADGTAPVASAMSPEEVGRRERLRSMKAEIESLNRQTAFKESEEARLRGAFSEYQRRIESVPGVESAWVALTRDYDTQQTAYKEMLAKSENAKVAVSLERRQIGEQFRVIDPAKVPQRPISPVRLVINAIGFAIGLFVGVGIAVLLEFKDSTYRSESDVLDALALPVLAVVPLVETAAETAQRLRRRKQISMVAASAVAICGYVFWSMRLWTQFL
jgi:polysaccharide chain length determinant protein (PEP-CTERM system associated)